jgi:hypothetical protein
VLTIIGSRTSNGVRNKQEAVLSDSPVGHSVLVCVGAVECNSQLGAVGKTRYTGDECGVGQSDGRIHVGGVHFGKEMLDAGIYRCEELATGRGNKMSKNYLPVVPF